MKIIAIIFFIMALSTVFGLFVGAFIKAGKGPAMPEHLDLDSREVL